MNTYLRAFRDTPVTYVLVYAVSGMSLWLGTTILTTTVKLPPVRLVGYAGPESLMPLRGWGWCFVIGGALGLLRPFAHEAPRLSLVMHLGKMLSLVAWALAFDFGGPPTTGQPCYTFLAIISFMTPFLPSMIQNRYGVRPPLDPEGLADHERRARELGAQHSQGATGF